MSKLLNRAKSALYGANEYRRQVSGEDADLDWACFLVHQSIELSLKYWIEMQGAAYKKTHDLNIHAEQLRFLGINDDLLDKIYDNAPMLNKWEAQARYNDNFTTVIKTLDESLIISKKLIECMENKFFKVSEDYDVYDLIPDAFKSKFSTKEECLNMWYLAHPELLDNNRNEK